MENQIFAQKPSSGQPWDVIIIGSGPAALTAAIYTTRGAASTLILGGEKWGGQLMLTTEVDNYPGQPGILGPDLMQKMREHSTKFGAEFVEKNAEKVNFSKKPFTLTAAGQAYLAKSVIVGTGAETKWLGIPGEDKLRGRGVSSCAPCDAPLFKNKQVMVIGGGDSAMEEALVLTKYATSVSIVHRRDKFRASQAMQKRVLDQEKAGKIRIIWDSQVTEFVGDQNLKKVKVKNLKTNEENEIAMDGAFVAIGHGPSTQLFKGQLELDEKGYIRIMTNDELQMINGYKTATSVPGVFVAGDVHDYYYKQAITAAGFGCMAAMDVLNYLDLLSNNSASS